MVQNAKQVALNIHDPKAASRWRDSNNALINAVINVRNAVSPDALPELDRLRIGMLSWVIANHAYLVNNSRPEARLILPIVVFR